MSIKRIKDFPEGSGTLTNDDIFLFMDDPSNSGVTKKVSLSNINTAINSAGLPVVSLGTLSGSNAINSGADNVIQLLTLNGSAVTFTKGTGWPTTSSTNTDTTLRITVSSPTTITWTLVTQWFNQAPAGALAVGTHLFLLRGIGTSIVEGHYIGAAS